MQLQVGTMNRGAAWLDTGTFESLADACEFVRVTEKRQSQKNRMYRGIGLKNWLY
jgi:glucose-1-phosphate thymidylyltransferase